MQCPCVINKYSLDCVHYFLALADIFQEALKDGFLDISMVSIMLVGSESPGATSAKHIAFQEAVPNTLKPTSFVNHEIYFRAEGDLTLKRVQPDRCDEFLSYSMSPPIKLSESAKNNDVPVYPPLNATPLSSPVPVQLPSQLPVTVPVERPSVPGLGSAKFYDGTQFKPPALNPLPSQHTEFTYDAPKPRVDSKKVIQECVDVKKFMDYMAQYKNEGKVEFFHVFDCGSCLVHMRELLKIFIKNISLCALVADLSKGVHPNVLRENVSFASKGIILGTHKDLVPDKCDGLTDMESIKELHDAGFLITEGSSVFCFNSKTPEKLDYETASNIVKHASLLATTKKFPFAWYLFGFKLKQAMAALNQNTLSISNECMIIARELKMDRPAVEAALQHLTEQNMILYFADILKDSVFSCVNVFSQLLSLLCSKFNSSAIISEFDFKEVIANAADKNVSVYNFIQLFKRLLILAVYHNNDPHISYLMPCLLPMKTEVESDEIHCSDVSTGSSEVFSTPAYIKCPSTGYEYMSMLVAFLLTETNNDWMISLDPSNAPKCLNKNCVQFLVSSLSVVNVSYSGGYLKVTVRFYSEGTLSYIRKTILRGLEKIKVITSADRAFHFKISFFCLCESSNRLHTALYDGKGETMICELTNAEVSLLSEDIACKQKWLEHEHIGM